MFSFSFKRILSALPVIIGVVTLVFLLIHFIPGDPVDMILGDNADAAEKLSLRETLGLNHSLSFQYLKFWKDLFQGGWGNSFSFKKSVLSLILERFPATVLLSFCSLVIAVLIAFPL